MIQALFFLKGSSGYVKIGRSTNFDKRLSEIRRGTTDEHVEVLKVFYGDDEYIRTRERELHLDLAADNFKGEWFYDTENVRQALESCDREFNPETFALQDLGK
jgi:Meiotically Up-regulated Gene 113 (MUG113) protein